MTVEDGQWGGRALGRVLHWGELGPDDEGTGGQSGKIWHGRACVPTAEVAQAVLLRWSVALVHLLVSNGQTKSLCYPHVVQSRPFQWVWACHSLESAGWIGGGLDDLRGHRTTVGVRF